MRYLSPENPSKCRETQPVHFLPPCGEQRYEATRLGGETRTASSPPTAGRGEHLRAQHALHLADPVEAGAIAPPDDLPRRADRPRAIDRIQEPQIARPHQEHSVPVEPQLLARHEVTAEGRTARGGHDGRRGESATFRLQS